MPGASTEVKPHGKRTVGSKAKDGDVEAKRGLAGGAEEWLGGWLAGWLEGEEKAKKGQS